MQLNHKFSMIIGKFLFLALWFLSSLFLIPYVHADQPPTPCKPESLPLEIQNRLKQDSSAWKIQEPADLSKFARERWESEKPVQCPGIAVGHFEHANNLSYAILLVPSHHPDAGYELLVFSRRDGQSAYKATTLDNWDSKGAGNYFIHETSISKFFDEPSRRKFRVQAAEGILLVDSSEDEQGVEIYFWSDSHYQHEPIDY